MWLEAYQLFRSRWESTLLPQILSSHVAIKTPLWTKKSELQPWSRNPAPMAHPTWRRARPKLRTVFATIMA